MKIFSRTTAIHISVSPVIPYLHSSGKPAYTFRYGEANPSNGILYFHYCPFLRQQRSKQIRLEGDLAASSEASSGFFILLNLCYVIRCEFSKQQDVLRSLLVIARNTHRQTIANHLKKKKLRRYPFGIWIILIELTAKYML